MFLHMFRVHYLIIYYIKSNVKNSSFIMPLNLFTLMLLLIVCVYLGGKREDFDYVLNVFIALR